jgi:minor histocompatibility antigen H13
LAHILSPILNKFIPEAFPQIPYHIIFTKGKDDKKEEVINYEFDSRDLLTLAICAVLGVWYLLKKVFQTLSQFFLFFNN